ncbi:MAG: C4-dicarboxylic acid transporter DauA, partial [Myxococcales bacterium]|nr:C4-dicarboxylic acid transporter DauA [Myxococcales bacterium]
MRYVDELTDALRAQLAVAAGIKDQLAYGLRSRLKEGYHAVDFRADLMAGLVVGVVALPLSMALAIASGVPPQHGLYTAIIAGIIVSLLGGTRVQVTGPTAAFVVILLPVVRDFGLPGLLVAGMMAGIILVLMGLARLGKLMEFIPHPVTTGFTAGIALVIAVLQLKGLLGVDPHALMGGKAAASDGVFDYVRSVGAALPDVSRWDVAIAAFTLALLIGLPRVIKKIPAPLLALVAASLAAWILGQVIEGFHVATIGSKFKTLIDGEAVSGIPPLPPLPGLPWATPDPGGVSFTLSFPMIKALLPSAFAIAVLGAIESLMAAVVADGMCGSKHDPNSELIALGLANIVCPFFGGIPATGALARTATNIRAGARSPFAATIHAVFVLACTIALAPLVSYLPMAAMAALLLVVAKNMSEARHFARLVRTAPRSDVMVLLTCFGLTVFFDMVIAVSVGVVLAALLFMRRMAVLTQVKLDTATHKEFDLPVGVRLYEIAGPMFFGAAKSAMDALETIHSDTTVVIISMRAVPVMDATGLVAFETILDRLHRSDRKVILAALQPDVADLLERAGIKRVPGKMAIAPDVETAISMAIVH